MSVDLEVVLSRPVRLGELIDHGRRVLAELLGGDAPELVVRDGARADRPLMSTAETAGIVLGQPVPDNDHFRVDVPATGDQVHVMAIDHADIDPEMGWEAVFSPSRSCVGVAVATGLALATAQVSEGRYVDGQIRMVPYDLGDPDIVIARTRLRAPVGDFDMRCEQYLRQFPHLGGWPRDRSAPS